MEDLSKQLNVQMVKLNIRPEARLFMEKVYGLAKGIAARAAEVPQVHDEIKEDDSKADTDQAGGPLGFGEGYCPMYALVDWCGVSLSSAEQVHNKVLETFEEHEEECGELHPVFRGVFSQFLRLMTPSRVLDNELTTAWETQFMVMNQQFNQIESFCHQWRLILNEHDDDFERRLREQWSPQRIMQLARDLWDQAELPLVNVDVMRMMMGMVADMPSACIPRRTHMDDWLGDGEVVAYKFHYERTHRAKCDNREEVALTSHSCASQENY